MNVRVTSPGAILSLKRSVSAVLIVIVVLVIMSSLSLAGEKGDRHDPKKDHVRNAFHDFKMCRNVKNQELYTRILRSSGVVEASSSAFRFKDKLFMLF
jgi:hypothetical protein